MNLRDIEAQAKALAPILRDYVTKAIEAASVSIDARIQAVESSCSDQIKAIPAPKDGENGKDADMIPLETVERMIAEAVEKAISALQLPKDGKDGRDALELDIQPRIDESKSYTRGALATHNGGLWRAHANTDGMRGWECIVEGVRGVDVEQVDERNIVNVVNMASGKQYKTPITLPTMIYRNVWKEGHYQKGDVVTWGGCIWHCDQDTDTKPSESAEHWTLAVKKGRDGKSA